jgi:cytochrome b561
MDKQTLDQRPIDVVEPKRRREERVSELNPVAGHLIFIAVAVVLLISGIIAGAEAEREHPEWFGFLDDNVRPSKDMLRTCAIYVQRGGTLPDVPADKH